MYRIFLILIFVLLTSGCANAPKTDSNHLATQAICCENVTKINFVQQNRKQQVKYDLKQQSVRSFGAFNSPFVAIEKPENSRFVQVFSYANGLFVNNATFVYPLVQVYDNDKKLISSVKPYEAWKNGLPTTLDMQGNLFYKTQFTLPTNAAYLLFYVDSRLVGESVTINWRSNVGGSDYRTLQFTNYAKVGINFL